MTRFQRELKGELGEYWRRHAEQEIEKMKERIEHDELRTNIGGGAFWSSNGHYLGSDLVEILTYTDFPFSPEETNRAREEQEKLFLEQYRASYTGPSEEELIEMRAAFGEGEEVINVLTGQRIRL